MSDIQMKWFVQGYGVFIQDQLSILDSFTGSPVPEDIMIYAIPVCAPYTAVTSYKYAGPSLHLVVYA